MHKHTTHRHHHSKAYLKIPKYTDVPCMLSVTGLAVLLVDEDKRKTDGLYGYMNNSVLFHSTPDTTLGLEPWSAGATRLLDKVMAAKVVGIGKDPLALDDDGAEGVAARFCITKLRTDVAGTDGGYYDVANGTAEMVTVDKSTEKRNVEVVAVAQINRQVRTATDTLNPKQLANSAFTRPYPHTIPETDRHASVHPVHGGHDHLERPLHRGRRHAQVHRDAPEPPICQERVRAPPRYRQRRQPLRAGREHGAGALRLAGAGSGGRRALR